MKNYIPFVCNGVGYKADLSLLEAISSPPISLFWMLSSNCPAAATLRPSARSVCHVLNASDEY